MIKYCIAEKEHLIGILELYKQLIPEEESIDLYRANEIWEKIVKNNIKYFIAIENSKIISSCYLAIIPNLTRNGRSNGFIENVITNENYRKKKVLVKK